MAEFAGYNMPIVYSSINEEHKAVRNTVGVFDVSHMGEFMIKRLPPYIPVQAYVGMALLLAFLAVCVGLCIQWARGG